MDYQRSIPLSGNPEKSLETAKMIFMQNGFRMKKKGERDLEFIGPGMNSTKECPLLGVSLARIQVSAGHLKMEAELGSARWMQRFLFLFPFALGTILFLSFAAIQKNWSVGFSAFLSVSPWLILSPIMSRWIRRRTTQALDVLMENAAQEE